MKRSLVGLVVVVVAVGCSGGGGKGDDAATGDDSTAQTCVQIQAELRQRVDTASRACTTVADCMMVGYALDNFGTPTCNTGVAFTYPCSGVAVNKAAWQGAPDILLLEQAWYTRCVPRGEADGVMGTSDCGVGTVACVANGCTADPYNCFSPPDAGVQ